MILLTGASGFIGSHFLARLSPDTQIRCLVRPSSASKVKRSNAVEVFEGDVRSPEAVGAAMKGVDTVIHLAALLRKRSASEIRRTNVEGTRLVVEEAKKNSVRKFIFVSTENALREDLDDPYAETKREAEALVGQLPDSLILRPCFVYGRGDDHGLGRLVELAEKSPLLPLFGGLESRIQPLYIDDMTEYLLRALKMDLKGSYVLAGPETLTLNDFLRRACAVRGHKRLFITLPRPLLSFLAACGDRLPALGWGHSQMRNIYFSRTYSIEKVVRDFQYKPRGIDEGLSLWLKQN